MLLFGLVGFAFNKLQYPPAPLVLAMVLGHKAEIAFHQSMAVSDGSLAVFWSNGLVGSIMTLGIALVVIPRLAKLNVFRRRTTEVPSGKTDVL